MLFIRCSRCGEEIPKKKKRNYKFLWFNFESTQHVYNYYEAGGDFNAHLCLDCMKDFENWISNTGKYKQK